MILATIERHKQNSETFNKAYNSSFSREDDHIPDSPVSLLLSRLAVTHGRPAVHHMSSPCSCSSFPEQLSIYGCGRTVDTNHIKKLLTLLTLADVASGRCSQQSSLSWPNREGWSLSVYKTRMDLLLTHFGLDVWRWTRKTRQKVLTDIWRYEFGTAGKRSWCLTDFIPLFRAPGAAPLSTQMARDCMKG